MKLKVYGLLLIFCFGGVSVVFGGQLTNISVTPNDNSAGAAAIYTISFTTSVIGNGVTVGIPADGKIMIGFPSGFDLTNAELAQSTDPAVLNGGLVVSVSNDTLTIERDNTGSAVGGNITVGVKVAVILNHQTAASTYALDIETRATDNSVIDSGTSSTFTITHDELASFQFNPISQQTAGNSFNATITAVDEFGNQVDNFSGTASVSDLSGTISPTSINFISGQWTGYQSNFK